MLFEAWNNLCSIIPPPSPPPPEGLCILSSPEFCHPASVSLMMSQHQQGAAAAAHPTHTRTHMPTLSIKLISHFFFFFFLEDMAVFSQTMSPPPPAPVPPPEPLTWLTALVFGIKCEADECVCGANYDIALRCQNILRTEFLHAGPRG